jgi:hypothetical protein
MEQMWRGSFVMFKWYLTGVHLPLLIVGKVQTETDTESGATLPRSAATRTPEVLNEKC